MLKVKNHTLWSGSQCDLWIPQDIKTHFCFLKIAKLMIYMPCCKEEGITFCDATAMDLDENLQFNAIEWVGPLRCTFVRVDNQNVAFRVDNRCAALVRAEESNGVYYTRVHADLDTFTTLVKDQPAYFHDMF